MGLKLEEDEYVELEFKAFAWFKWGPSLNGSWSKFVVTNKRLIVVDRIFSFAKSSIPWENITAVGEGEKGLHIEGTWRKRKMEIDMGTKKMDDGTIMQFIQLVRDHSSL